MTSSLRQVDVAPRSGSTIGAARAVRLAWGFVVLGVVIRLVVYLMRFPLWVDECMLAENYLDRSFLGLLAPLDHHQVAPIGFLWIELAVVKLLGFSEWSLRLFPLICGIGGLFLFRHVASRLLTGLPLVLAVGSVAVAKASIGLSADAKPYASDLFVAVALLAIAVEWLRQPERTTWLWLLALAVPVALALSFPAVFVAGAISAGLALPVIRRRNLRTQIAFAAYNAALGLAFLGLYRLSTGEQAAAHESFMVKYWSQFDAFPPLAAGKLAAWLASVHIGDKVFAVPYGAENGGGLIALVCLVCGCFTMYRNGQRPVMTIFLGTFGLALVASAGRHYPYGGHARLNQFLAPAQAVMCGLGAAALLASMHHPRLRQRLTMGLVAGLALFGTGIAGRAIQHPYHHPYDVQQRDFARRVWAGDSSAITVCALTDLNQKFWADGWYPYYRCNQRIYSRRHHSGLTIDAGTLARLDSPVQLVIYRPPNKLLEQKSLHDCLWRFERNLDWAGCEVLTLSAPDLGPETSDAYEIHRFELRHDQPRRDMATMQPL